MNKKIIIVGSFLGTIFLFFAIFSQLPGKDSNIKNDRHLTKINKETFPKKGHNHQKKSSTSKTSQNILDYELTIFRLLIWFVFMIIFHCRQFVSCIQHETCFEHHVFAGEKDCYVASIWDILGFLVFIAPFLITVISCIFGKKKNGE